MGTSAFGRVDRSNDKRKKPHQDRMLIIRELTVQARLQIKKTSGLKLHRMVGKEKSWVKAKRKQEPQMHTIRAP